MITHMHTHAHTQNIYNIYYPLCVRYNKIMIMAYKIPFSMSMTVQILTYETF